MKKILMCAGLLALVSCGATTTTDTKTTPENAPTAENSAQISVSSSIIPLSSVINTVGGEFVEVHNIIPAGVSPHGFDMSARDMAQLENSEIVFMTGLEHIDGFLEKAAQGKTQVHLADGMELLEAAAHDHSDHEGEEHAEDEHGHEDEHHDEHADEHHDDHEGEHSDEHSEEHAHEDEHTDEHVEEEGHDEHGHEDVHSKDPHVWLGKDNIIEIAGKVRDELATILPEQADYFAANTETFVESIEKTFSDFSAEVEGKTASEFIVFHDAYNYLFESIQLDENLKIAFSENVLHETGTAHMAELIDEIKLHGIKNIFREPQFSDTNLKKFTSEYNLTVGTLDPLGTDESANGYITNLQNNLESLRNIYE